MSDLPNLYSGLPDRQSEWNNYDARITGGATVKTDGERNLLLAKPEGWTSQALCIGRFEEFDARATSALAESARQTCSQCPVRAECLAQAVQQEWTVGRADYVGIRGGLDARERYKYIRSLKESAKLDVQRDSVA